MKKLESEFIKIVDKEFWSLIEENKMEKCNVGIDLSLTGTGFVVVNMSGEVIHQELLKSDSKDKTEARLQCLMDQIWACLGKYVNNKYEINNFNLEGLSFGSKGQSMLELAGLHYFVRTELDKNGFNFKVVPPSSLKKFVTGKGNSKKELMLLNVYKKWKIEFTDNNLADAYCLARYEEN